MKIQTIILILFTIVFVGVIYKVRFSKSSRDENVLIVGTSPDYPPYEFINVKTGEVEGFDIDIVKEISHRLGKTLEIKAMPFTSLIFGLLTGDIDMIASGIGPTPQRARLVSFSNLYFQGLPLVILSKVDQFVPKTVADLAGKTVAVNTGYVSDVYMSKQPGVELIRLDSPADCFLALQAGMVDAFVCDQSPIQLFLQQTAHPEQYVMVEISGAGENFAFAVNKNNTQLLQEINSTLDAMMKDGTLTLLQQKWNP